MNARHTKNLPGRKSDIQECQWLLKLHTFGLLNNSFQPSDQTRVARTLWRHRGGLVAEASSTIQRMQKVLTGMNIQLSNVLSDLSGVSGMRIVQAILDGERDPKELAALADPGVKASPAVIAKSLRGNWRGELLFVLQQEVELYRIWRSKIADCDREFRAKVALRQSASTLERSQSYLGAQYRRLKARLGAPKAITAMARKLACLFYRLLKYSQQYLDKVLNSMRSATKNNRSDLSLAEPNSMDCKYFQQQHPPSERDGF